MLRYLFGPVVHGQGKGAAAGFPTANLSLPEGAALPPRGVYAVRAWLAEGPALGLTNVGPRPTADDSPQWTVETWLPDLAENLYGQSLRLEFLAWLRDIRPFPGMQALKAQIDRDLESARAAYARFRDSVTCLTFSARDTQQFAASLAPALASGAVLALFGDMGAGKSEFARGVARGLGFTGPVPSPSFTILNAYDEGRLPLYHFDWYRVEDPEELTEIGAADYLPGDGVTLVEWPERAPELLPARRLEIMFQPIGDEARLIALSAKGGFAQPMPKEFMPC